jgi:hypothetical protein
MRDDFLNGIWQAAADGLLFARREDSEGSERRFVERLRIAARTEFLLAHGDLWLARSLARETVVDAAGALAAAGRALTFFERKEQRPIQDRPSQTGRTPRLTDDPQDDERGGFDRLSRFRLRASVRLGGKRRRWSERP